MDRDKQRAMMDRVGRDEAASLRTQQEAAGNVHGPVHTNPPHGEPSQTPRGALATTELSRTYLQALDAERAAWQALGGLPGDAAFDEAAWNVWRTAVEERDLATRRLINYALSPPLP
jgi:hypothetical protein